MPVDSSVHVMIGVHGSQLRLFFKGRHRLAVKNNTHTRTLMLNPTWVEVFLPL